MELVRRVPCGLPRYFAHSSINEVHSCTTLLFAQLREEATVLLSSPLIATLVQRHILEHETLPVALASLMSSKLCGDDCDAGPSHTWHALKKHIGATLRSPTLYTSVEPVLFAAGAKGPQRLAAHAADHVLGRARVCGERGERAGANNI